MAVHKSALKRMRQNRVRRMRNRGVKTNIKTMIKRVRMAAEEKNKKKAAEALSRVIPLIDKAVVKGVLHKNNGARKISRLNRLVNNVG